jgi:hypothetical protein
MPLKQANYKKEIGNYFIFQERVIWFYQYERDGKKLSTFFRTIHCETIQLRSKKEIVAQCVSRQNGD